MCKRNYVIAVFFSLILCSAGKSAPMEVGQSVKVVVNEKVLENGLEATDVTIVISNYNLQQVEVGDEEYDLYSIENELTISREGWPDLPFIAHTIIIPPQSDILLEVKKEISHIEANISPAIAPRELNDGTFEHIGEVAEYQQYDGFYPPNSIEIGKPAILRGYRLVTIRSYPMQFNRSTGEMKINETINCQLTYDGIGENIVQDPERARPSEYIYKMLENLVENPPAAPDRDDVISGNYLYIVPDVEGVMAAVLPLIEWRRRQGHHVTVSQVANNANLESIRDIINGAYESEHPVEFVAFVGDAVSPIRVQAWGSYGDYGYSCIEGGDALPDIAIGRISCSSVNELRRIVHKLVSYESNPYMEDTDWYKRGAVVAGHIENGLGTVLLAKYVRNLMLNHGVEEVDAWYHNEDGEIRGDQDFVSDAFDDGVSLFHYRAFSRMNALNQNVLWNLRNRQGMWPTVLAVSCNTGNFVQETSYTEVFLRAEGGGIGCIGTATGNTNVKFNNLVSGGFWRAVLQEQIYSFGWGLNAGKYQLWQAYQGLDNEYINFMDWNNLMGDPGTHIITGVPRLIEVSHPRTISLGESWVTVVVDDDEDEVPMPDALVCLYMGDEFQELRYTNENGEAEFYINPERLEEGDLLVTVTKHNVKPYLGEIEVVEQEFYLGVSDPEVVDDNDGDGELNPGETVELSVQVNNFGTEVPDGEITMRVESLSQWVTAQAEEISLEESPNVNESVNITFTIDIHPSCPDEELILLPIELTDGESVWSSIISLRAVSPHIMIEDVVFVGGLNPGEIVDTNVGLVNIGNKRLDASTAKIWSENLALRVIVDEADYPSIGVDFDRFNELPTFQVSVHPMAVPGMTVWLGIGIETDDGFLDSSRVQITIGAPEETDPFGPDKYGYVCYDSGDDWDLAPEYNWIEIDRNINNNDFNGTELNLRDNADNNDKSVVVNLPFDFQYYGEVFDKITICTNGWAAFGDQAELAAFRNRHIGQALGPNAQLCVWWDNLITTNNSEILTYYDDDSDVFIIEWSRMRRLIEAGQGANETFQIILQNPETYITETGDGIIIYQYKDIENQRSAAHNDTPYSTIGIGNLDDSGGLEYTYWNGYPDGAKAIESEMAIKFITTPAYECGSIQGMVTDAETDEPIQNANVLLTHGFIGITDENGNYLIEDVLINDDYSVTVWAQGWNDSTVGVFEIALDETLTVDISLLHPEFNPSQQQFSERLPNEDVQTVEFSLSNSGNGLLEWEVDRTVESEVDFDEWEHRDEYLLAQLVDDAHIEGAVFVDDHFYVPGGGNDTNYVYVFDRDGEEVNRFVQFDESRYGMRDLAYDGDLIWGSESSTFYGFNTDGELITEFETEFGSIRALAWDSDNNVLWVTSSIEDIIGIDREGNEIFRIDRPADNRVYSLAYWFDAPDSYKLYFSSRRGGSYSEVYKMDIETEEYIRVTTLDVGVDGRPALYGMYITNEIDPYSWVLVSTLSINAALGGDRIDIWEMGPRIDWMSLEPEQGTLLPGEEQEIELTLDASGFPMDTQINGNLVFHHNALGGITELPVTMEVIAGPGALDERTLHLTGGWNMVSLNIIPEELNIPELMAPLTDNGTLQLMKNGSGQFYLPNENFNSIERWEVAEGYKMYLSDPAEWTVEGRVVDPADSLELRLGWNMISYYLREPVDVDIALSNIHEQLIIAKDIQGHFYLPDFDYSNMNPMSEGLGYYVKTTEDIALVYHSGGQVATIAPSIPEPIHFQHVSPTEQNMSLLIIGDENSTNWELGVFISGSLVGAGRVDVTGNCGVTVWGQDDSIDEPLSFKLWNGYNELDILIEAVQGQPMWSADGIFVGKVIQTQLPVEFGIQNAYPNPFNNSVRMRYGVEQAGLVTIKLFDLTGREVAVMSNTHQTVGYHSIIWEAGSLPSGLYIARMNQNIMGQSDQISSSIKLMLLK